MLQKIKQRIKIRSGSVFIKFLIIFNLVALIPVVSLGFLSYFVFSNSLEKETQKYNDLLLNETWNNVENKMQEFRQLLYQTVFLVNVDVHNFLKLNEVKQIIERLKHTNEFIDDIFVYYYEIDRVMKAEGMYHANFFFESNERLRSIDHDTWMTLSKERNHFEIVTAKSTEPQEKTLIAVLMSFPLYASETKGSIIVFIDEQKIYSILKSLNQHSSQSSVLIVNSNMEPLTGSITEVLQKAYYEPILQNPNNQKNRSVSSYPSQVTDWIYLVITDLIREWMIAFTKSLFYDGVEARCSWTLKNTSNRLNILNWTMYYLSIKVGERSKMQNRCRR